MTAGSSAAASRAVRSARLTARRSPSSSASQASSRSRSSSGSSASSSVMPLLYPGGAPAQRSCPSASARCVAWHGRKPLNRHPSVGRIVPSLARRWVVAYNYQPGSAPARSCARSRPSGRRRCASPDAPPTAASCSAKTAPRGGTPQAQGWLVDDRRPARRRPVPDHGRRGRLARPSGGASPALDAAVAAWLAEPDDDLVMLLARSLGDARLGGSGWLEVGGRRRARGRPPAGAPRARGPGAARRLTPRSAAGRWRAPGRSLV